MAVLTVPVYAPLTNSEREASDSGDSGGCGSLRTAFLLLTCLLAATVMAACDQSETDITRETLTQGTQHPPPTYSPSPTASPQPTATPVTPAPEPSPAPAKDEATPLPTPVPTETIVAATSTITAEATRASGAATPTASVTTYTAAADSQQPSGSQPQIAAEVGSLVNQVRVASGLVALRVDNTLTAVASAYAQALAQSQPSDLRQAHRGPDGETHVERLSVAGYNDGAPVASGEVLIRVGLAPGQPASSQAILDAWLGSPPHAELILKPDFTEVGIGCATDAPEEQPRSLYCVMELASPAR